MCRLYGLRAIEPTKVECSLVRAPNALLAQSRIDRRGETHADGWGVAYYDDEIPRIERRETAAFDDAHFSTTAERVYARTVLAHVRQATVGGASLPNTHPFVHGPWLFAHNGTVWGFDSIRPKLDCRTDSDLAALRRGTTDSEIIFYWMLSQFRRAGLDPLMPCAERSQLSQLIEIIQRATRELDALSLAADSEKPPRLNFMLTDGAVLLASRWNQTLHWVEREGIHECKICGIPHVSHEPTESYRAVVVASEPITDEPWREVENQSMLIIDTDVEARIVSL